jgi:hypothetical protein
MVINYLNGNISRDSNGGYAESIDIRSTDKRNKMNEENSLDSGLDELYHSYWEVHNEKMSSHSPLEIAAILMTQSLTIYKTVLDEDEYNRMVDSISDLRDQVKEIPESGSILH